MSDLDGALAHLETKGYAVINESRCHYVIRVLRDLELDDLELDDLELDDLELDDLELDDLELDDLELDDVATVK